MLSDLQELLAIAGNVSLVVTLVFLTYQLFHERKEHRYAVYEKLMSDFTQVSLLLSTEPDLAYAYRSTYKTSKWDNYTEDEKRLFCYFDSLFGLFERVWIALRRGRKGTGANWVHWRNWIKLLATHSVFVDVFEFNKEFYDSNFIHEVQNVVAEAKYCQKPKNVCRIFQETERVYVV